MKVLLYAVLGIIGLALVALGIGVELKPEWRVERSAVIQAPPGPVFAYVSVLHNWSEWTVWNTKDHPSYKYTPIGPDWGIGAGLQWDTGDRNSGEMEVNEYVPGEYMEYELTMDKGREKMRGSLRIEPATGGGSRLTWTGWGDAGSNPIRKLMMLAYGRVIGHDYAGGLANIQQRFAQARDQTGIPAESRHAQPAQQPSLQAPDSAQPDSTQPGTNPPVNGDHTRADHGGQDPEAQD